MNLQAHHAIRRGDIYYIATGDYTGSEQQGGRPGIIVSNEMNNRYSNTVEIVYLTTRFKKYLPTHIKVYSAPRYSTALCEQVHTVSVERLGNYVGHLTHSEMEQLDYALKCSLALK